MMKIAYLMHEKLPWKDLKVRIDDENDQTTGHQAHQLFWMRYLGHIRDHWWKNRGKGATVAILDTGIDRTHPAFSIPDKHCQNFTDEGDGDNVQDENGHGTHVAGIIAAKRYGKAEKASEFEGLAPKATLLIGKVLNQYGEGSSEWVAKGIDWAVDKGADIISLSMSGPHNTGVLFEAVYRAMAAGVCVIAAAGNEGSLAQNAIGYPGRYGGVITVAAHDTFGRPSLFSSSGGEIDFMAPGAEIWSTFPEKSFARFSGTSMAAPFVAGLSALIIAVHQPGKRHETPIRNNEDLKQHLMRMATHPGSHDDTTGYGALIPFKTVGTSLPLSNFPDLQSAIIYRSTYEQQIEFDDRVDYFLTQKREYWLDFIRKSSGKAWEGKMYSEHMKVIENYASGVAFIVHKSQLTYSRKLEKAFGKSDCSLRKVRHEQLLRQIMPERFKKQSLEEETPFLGQPSVSGFTGFLIGEDRLLSCRHGFYSAGITENPSDFVAVFGYRMKENKRTKKAQTTFEDYEVFSIKSVLCESPKKDSRQDWLVAKLERSVDTNQYRPIPIPQKPKELKRVENLEVGTHLYMLGHPLGLPLKFTPDGQIGEKTSNQYYKVNLDAFKGNSGSPVFEIETQTLVGIFVSGLGMEFELAEDGETIQLREVVLDNPGEAYERVQVVSTPLRKLAKLPKA